jgi:hypothetical protein
MPKRMRSSSDGTKPMRWRAKEAKERTGKETRTGSSLRRSQFVRKERSSQRSGHRQAVANVSERAKDAGSPTSLIVTGAAV